MSHTREALKRQAKQSLKTNYWRVVLVSLILFIVGGGLSSSTAQSNSARNTFNQTYSYADYDDTWDDDFDDWDDWDIEITTPSSQDTSLSTTFSIFNFNLSSLSSFAVLLILIVAAVLILLSIFVFAPLSVGCIRFFLVNLHFPANLGELRHPFDHNYMTTVKTMFLRTLKIILWTLLFIIPGIVKSYEYRMVPYLLAECPDMDSKEVFAASARLMDGNKWRAFVLDLSFILWDLLSDLTLGLVGVFYVNPYKDLTNAAFYQAVCQENNGGTPVEDAF